MKKLNNQYRSSLRDSPQHIPFDLTSLLKNNKSIEKKYDLLYDWKEDKFTNIFDTIITKNFALSSSYLSKYIERINNLLDMQYEIMSNYIWCYKTSFIKLNDVNTVLFTSFHKSLINLASILLLTKNGLWGTARPLIRQTLESLIIAKYCSINPNSSIYDLWLDGEQISLGNIFNSLKTPNVKQLKGLWGSLSDFTHSSIYSSQINLDIKPNIKESLLNLLLIEILLECKYHLLISHVITKNMTYYQKMYMKEKYLKVQELKNILRKEYSQSRKKMSKDAKEFIKDYKSTWTIKS